MTTFKPSRDVGERAALHPGAPMTVAQIAQAVIAEPLPFHLTAFDGSSAGPPDAAFGAHLATQRGLSYLLTAPGDLGMARAYIAGDLLFSGGHPADPYLLLRTLADGLHLRRPPLAGIAAIARSLGWSGLTPVAPPPQEAPPRWRRALRGLRHTKGRDADAISRHYDVSNTFYEYVLGPSMAYTCAVYPTVDSTLDEAQDAKCALILDKLDVQPGQRLLDVGCGWGSVVRSAARRGVKVLGVTLSPEQAVWAQRAIRQEGLQDLAEVRHQDYRDVRESDFDAVSSVGLTEHIGVANYPAYFTALQDRLRPGGRLLNHSITRPGNESAVKTGAFIDRYVFPDGELTGSGRIITDMQNVGFEVRHTENLREHYGLTLRDWCANLQANWNSCVTEVGEGTAKVWGLYMAASRLSFERNEIQLHQVLAVKPKPGGDAAVPLRPWWRN
ncbi:MAG: class I SAM-dependent methyltransferase [Nakamurella sp.]